MSPVEWVIVGALLLAALVVWAFLYLLVRRAFAMKPVRQHTDEEIKGVARGVVDMASRHYDLRRANELTVWLPRKGRRAGEPTIQVNVRRDEDEPWGWAK